MTIVSWTQGGGPGELDMPGHTEPSLAAITVLGGFLVVNVF